MAHRIWHFMSRSSLACALYFVIGMVAILGGSLRLEQYVRDIGEARQGVNWERATDSTVAITNSRGGINGTGFFINKDGDTVTAAHVVRGIQSNKEKVFVRIRGHRELHYVRIIAINDGLDIAILRTGIKTDSFFILKESDSLRPGDKLYVIGHPYGVPWQITEGLFSRQEVADGHMLLWVSVWIERGCSGGPLLNSKGEVVGLVHAFYNYFAPVAAHTNLCVTGTDIIRLLQAARGS